MWVLESRAGFEVSASKFFLWLNKHGLKVKDAECWSQTNQQCEIKAAIEEKFWVNLHLADEKGVG